VPGEHGEEEHVGYISLPCLQESVRTCGFIILYVCADTARYTEAIDLLSRTAVFTFIGLETFYSLSKRVAATNHTLLNNVPTVLQRDIIYLSITLRLPLNFFQSVEGLPEDPATTLEGTEQGFVTAQSWMQLGSMLGQFSSLTSLRLWFDHSEPCTWSVVNERRLLSPLLTQLSTTGIDVSVILPKLHPRHEREDRHFISKPLGTFVQLHRQLRQEYYVQETSQGDIEIVTKLDFPFFQDFFPGMPLAEIEAWERKLWDCGRDMEAEYEEETKYGFGCPPCLL
jgi:hypothetical protein